MRMRPYPFVACRDYPAKNTCVDLWQQLIRAHPGDAPIEGHSFILNDGNLARHSE
jgi:hypothetical protein